MKIRYNVVEMMDGCGNTMFRIEKKWLVFRWWYTEVHCGGGDFIPEYRTRENAMDAIKRLETKELSDKRIRVS